MRKRPEYNPEVIGQNLRRLREEKGYSVEEIRDYLCLGSRQAVYKYENGKSYPSADTMFALMELYDVDIRDIVESPEDRPDRRSFEPPLCWVCREYFCGIADNTLLVLG